MGDATVRETTPSASKESSPRCFSSCTSANSNWFYLQVAWFIRGPNSRDVLPPANTDIREPVNGSFFFRDGEEGAHSIELRILPHGEVEVEEMFVIELSIMSGELDVDPQAGSITLKVLHCIMLASLNQ